MRFSENFRKGEIILDHAFTLLRIFIFTSHHVYVSARKQEFKDKGMDLPVLDRKEEYQMIFTAWKELEGTPGKWGN